MTSRGEETGGVDGRHQKNFRKGQALLPIRRKDLRSNKQKDEGNLSWGMRENGKIARKGSIPAPDQKRH